MTPIACRFFSDATDWESPPVSHPGSPTRNACTVTTELRASPTPERLDELLTEFPDYKLHTRSMYGWTALAVAIDNKAMPLIQHILNKAPELVNAAWHDCEEPYIVTATFDLHILKEFISRGAKVNLADPTGSTALSAAACDAERLHIAKYLLQHGGIIYNQERDSVLESPHSEEEDKTEYREQPRIIDAALTLILGENMFLNGALHSARTEPTPTPSLLPYEIRGKIWSFLTGIDAPSCT